MAKKMSEFAGSPSPPSTMHRNFRQNERYQGPDLSYILTIHKSEHWDSEVPRLFRALYPPRPSLNGVDAVRIIRSGLSLLDPPLNRVWSPYIFPRARIQRGLQRSQHDVVHPNILWQRLPRRMDRQRMDRQCREHLLSRALFCCRVCALNRHERISPLEQG